MHALRAFHCLALAGLGAIAGCRTPAAPMPDHEQQADQFDFVQRTFADGTPDFVVDGALDSVVLIADPVHSAVGSGTVISPDHILTALHVVDEMARDERGHLLMEVDGVPLAAVLEACGNVDAPHGDWAVLAFDRPYWSQVAFVHPQAGDESWAPAREQELLLVGYAAGFFPDLHVNVDAPTPSVAVRISEAGNEHPCWYAVGDELHLAGMSGGGVMIWNHEAGRAELMGVFRGYVGTETRIVETERILGTVVSQRETSKPGIAYTIHRLPELIRNPQPPYRAGLEDPVSGPQ
ncbi:MAG: trypsin-like peptidase domain-containing protein [Planctomycetota bacterium]